MRICVRVHVSAILCCSQRLNWICRYFFWFSAYHRNCLIMYQVYISLDVIAKFKYWIPIEKMNKDKSDRSFFCEFVCVCVCVVCALFFMFVKILHKVFQSSETSRFPSLSFSLSPFHGRFRCFGFRYSRAICRFDPLDKNKKNRFLLCSFFSLDTLVSVTSI